MCELYNAYSRTFIVVHLGVSYQTIEPCCNCTIKLNVICTKHVCCTAACTLYASVVHFENAAYASGLRVSTLVFKYRRCGRLGGLVSSRRHNVGKVSVSNESQLQIVRPICKSTGIVQSERVQL